ncbi:MAG: hypothetical protein CL955_00540 [Erythrobacteraceae bacterium]|jgi:hypothetical protein|nr:hypothetical protein [Erythrobacteraceae bacterium]
MAHSPQPARRCGRFVPLFAASLAVLGASPALAQDESGDASGDYLNGLKACQQITEDAARLACFDSAVGSMVAATETGDVQVIDREDVRQTRRSLFGFSLPDLGIFGGSDEEESQELFTTTLANVRYTGRNSARVTTAEGAVWEMNNIPSSRRRFEVGDEVKFKEASLGFYFLRIGGQTGVKGRRVQ